jgi:hypothetical protein
MTTRQRRRLVRESRLNRKFIVCTNGVRIETTTCVWCTDRTVCSACHARALRAEQKRREAHERL